MAQPPKNILGNNIEHQLMGINFHTKPQNIELISNQPDQQNRKKPPIDIPDTPTHQMDLQTNHHPKTTFIQLPDKLQFYLVEVYQQFNNRLLISGVLPNHQTINIIASDNYRDLFFCLKNQTNNSNIHSEAFLQKAKEEIDERLKLSGINIEYSAFQMKQYVFEMREIPRGTRLYYRVRYSFKVESEDSPQPNWEGRFFKYVFGTTYTPLEIFIINSQIKGPSWVEIDKNFLSEKMPKSQLGLTVEVINPEEIRPIEEKRRAPSMRVMSVSIKCAIPSKVKLKRLFPTNRIDDMHLFALSYHYCQSYTVDSKPTKPSTITKTLYLKQFMTKPITKDQISCMDEKDLLNHFINDLRLYDPDFIVCHDASYIIDNLIQKIVICQKDVMPRLGRFTLGGYLNKNNQMQRINSCLVGRLIVDTFGHCKDMIKDVDYSLESMCKHIQPAKKFTGMTDEDMIESLNQLKTHDVIKKCREQSQATFDLMNHLEVIQMTASLSNICGNTWKRSLELQRAERNQFLLMHQCIKKDLIVPDKYKVGKGEEMDEADRKKYTGGLVLNPEIGMYNDFILLLDFNSLYPSLIREYNICFSIIERPLLPFSYYYKPKQAKKDKKKEKMELEGEQNEVIGEQIQVKPPPPQQCAKQKWGFLPQVIDKIVERRKKCKQQMKKATQQKVVILDIQQKSYKVVANSIYGCLGFKYNRFYSKHLAALVTRMGRQALIRAKDIVNGRGSFKVIYGDTDSLMLQPINFTSDNNKDKILELKNLANELKKEINRSYKNLQIDVDGVYKPLILMQKKKYVANKLTNYEDVVLSKVQPKFNIEYKGIEVVRRDGCLISRVVLEDVIKILMNQQIADDKEKMLEEVVQYFIQLNTNLPTLVEKDYRKFLLANFLSKKPREYAQGESLSHVKVALDRLRNGQKEQTLANHYIYYVICQPQNQMQDSYAKRSWDDKTFEKSQKSTNEKDKLKIDLEYYKIEILRPVSRILKTVGISIDRVCDEMKVKKLQKDKLKKFVEEEEEKQGLDYSIQGNILQLVLNRDIHQKIMKLEEEIGCFKCCDKGQSLILNSAFRVRCQLCGKQLLVNLFNKIMLMIKKKLKLYYIPSFRCKCNRHYILNPISNCCKVTYKEKSTIPYHLHDMLYLCKDTCEKTMKNLDSKDLVDRMKQVNNMIERFLSNSQYQDLGNLFSKMQF